MSKYSNEFKLEVIKYYLEEKHSYPECCKKFNIPDFKSIRQWVHKYELYGVEGIIKRLKSSYDGKFKQNVVEYIEYYNNRRTKSKLKGMPPVQYREHSMFVA